jgi:hypothetical protein
LTGLDLERELIKSAIFFVFDQQMTGGLSKKCATSGVFSIKCQCNRRVLETFMLAKVLLKGRFRKNHPVFSE